MARGGVGPAVKRRTWLLYLLASTYLAARLVIGRLALGRWVFDLELAAVAVAVVVAQLLILELAPRLLQNPDDDPGDANRPSKAGVE